jgi:SMI1-KNR4 cell-wall
MDFTELETQILSRPDRMQGQGATASEIAGAESILATRFSAGFRAFLEHFGWLALEDVEIYGIGHGVPKHMNLIEITLSERTEMRPKLRQDLVPLMNDGGGNLYCLAPATESAGAGAIVFWDHDLGADQEPEIIAASFEEWLSAKLRDRRM